MKRKISTILFGLMFLLGFGILVYPTVSDQWNTCLLYTSNIKHEYMGQRFSAKRGYDYGAHADNA